MTYEELVAELEAALVPEDAVDIILALVTRAYDDGYVNGVKKERARLVAAIVPARLPEPDPALNAYMG